MTKLYREILADIEKQEEKEEYKRIKKLKTLLPDELWEITDENFYKWVNKRHTCLKCCTIEIKHVYGRL